MNSMKLDGPVYSAAIAPSSPSLSSPVSDDDSPPSSPLLPPAGLPSTSPGLPHPFAASTKAVRGFSAYEKRENRRKKNFDTSRESVRETLSSNNYTAIRVQGSPSSSRVVDPYAASAKGEWIPPLWEKKIPRVVPGAGATSTPSPRIHAYRVHDSITPSAVGPEVSDLGDTDTEEPFFSNTNRDRALNRASLSFSMEGEQSLWDKEISRAIEKATGIIDLSYHNLGKGVINSIPPTIGDLSKLVVLPRHHASVIASPSPTESSSFIRPVQRTRALSRSVTLPASAFQASCSGVSPLPSPPRAATRTVSSSEFMEAAAAPWHNEIQLFLANNRIKTLPLELFNVTALTVLILRSNELVSIPPQITRLAQLRELNIVRNKLRWLPAEMLQMRLQTLALSGNPWIPLPTSWNKNTGKKPVSETMAHCSVPLLSELCFRVLLAPPEPTATNTQSVAGQGTQTTILQSLYQCPLEVKAPLVYETLKACVPDAVSKPTEQLSMRKRLRSSSGEKGEALQQGYADEGDEGERATPPGIWTCPSPAHRTPDGQWVNGRPPVFVQPAEERWTWEDIIAGVQVGAQGVSGAGVPVLWRGCGRGCLDFLDGEKTLPQGDDGPDERMDVDADMGEDEDAVQIVQLGMDGLVDPAEFA